MRLGLACLLLPLVLGCASVSGGNTPQAVCQRDALDDPNVKQLTVEQMNSGYMSPKAQFSYTQAVHDAYNDCLRRHGIVVRGGVEAVRPSY